MAFAKQITSKQRSHESYMFRNLDSELPSKGEIKGLNSSFGLRTSSPISRNLGLASIPPPSCANFSAKGSNSGDSYIMSYAVSSPIPSPVPYSFGITNLGSGIPAPVLLSVSAPVSPTLGHSPNERQKSVPASGHKQHTTERPSVPSQMPCVPKPVKICRQVSVPQSLHSQRAALQQRAPSALRPVNPSALRRLSNCRIGLM